MYWGYITQALLSCDDLCFHKSGYKIPSYRLSSLKTAERHNNSLVFPCTSRAESNASWTLGQIYIHERVLSQHWSDYFSDNNIIMVKKYV